MQRGNVIGAKKLLERCVLLDPAKATVMRWQPVVEALDAAAALLDARRAAHRRHSAGGRRGISGNDCVDGAEPRFDEALSIAGVPGSDASTGMADCC